MRGPLDSLPGCDGGGRLTGLELKEVTTTADPDLRALSDLMLATFADSNIVLSYERMAEFVDQREGAGRSFHVLAARDAGAVVGGVVFSHVPASGCGFSEYIVVHKDYRGRRLGRLLFDERKVILDTRARAAGFPACRGLFIEVESPERTPPAFLEQERETALDAVERWRVFHRMGFLRCGLPYVQPPLGPGKDPIDYMDLLFIPWAADAAAARQIPPDWVLSTVAPVWRSWVPGQYQEFLTWLGNQMGTRPVDLIPLFSE